MAGVQSESSTDDCGYSHYTFGQEKDHPRLYAGAGEPQRGQDDVFKSHLVSLVRLSDDQTTRTCPCGVASWLRRETTHMDMLMIVAVAGPRSGPVAICGDIAALLSASV